MCIDFFFFFYREGESIRRRVFPKTGTEKREERVTGRSKSTTAETRRPNFLFAGQYFLAIPLQSFAADLLEIKVKHRFPFQRINVSVTSASIDNENENVSRKRKTIKVFYISIDVQNKNIIVVYATRGCESIHKITLSNEIR